MFKYMVCSFTADGILLYIERFKTLKSAQNYFAACKRYDKQHTHVLHKMA